MRQRIFLPSLVSFFLLAYSATGYALYPELHSILAYEASLLPEVPSEFRVYAGDTARCTEGLGDSICGGAYDEDAERDPRLTGFNPATLIGLLNYGTHFWQPDDGPGGGRLDSVNGLKINLDSHNAYQRARTLYESARSLYKTEPLSSYHILGRITHLLTDMASPAHVHLDPHISDFTVTGDDSFEEFTAEKYVYADSSVGITAFEKDFPLISLSAVDLAGLSDGGFNGEPLIFKLFYSMAGISIGFDSDDADGKVDAGGRRGMSVKVSRGDIAGVFALRGGYAEEPLSFGYQTSPARSKFILLNATLDILKNASPPYGGVKLVFSDGSHEIHSLSDFTRSDMGDEDTASANAVLLPSAVNHTAALYKLFWKDTHPLLGEDSAKVILNSGFHRLSIARPALVDLRVDVAAKGWAGTEVEVYAWADVPAVASTLRFYFDRQWLPVKDLSEMKPAVPSFRLADLQDLVWRILDETSGVPDISLTVNLCIDRMPDGRYTPDESVCSGVLISVR